MKITKEFAYGVKVVENSKNEWGVTDLEGNFIVPFGKYDWIDLFDKGYA